MAILQPPILRAHDGEERHATWLELFLDLVFVAAIAKVSHVVSDHFEPKYVWDYALLFTPIWWCWVGHVFFANRFDADDLGQRFVTFLQMFAVAAMALYAPYALTTGSEGFVAGYVGFRALLILQYIRAAHHIPVARPLSRFYSIGFTVAALVWVGSLLLPIELRPIAWIVGMLIDLMTPILAGQLAITVPVHPTHAPERMGLFTIIVLGEGVMAIIANLSPKEVHPAAIATGLIAMLGFGAVWWDYFDGVRGANDRRTADPTAARRLRIWLYSHLLLQGTIPILAISVGRLIRTPAGSTPDFVTVAFAAISASFLIQLFNWVWSTAPILTGQRTMQRQIAPYLATGFLPLIALAMSGAPAFLVALAIFVPFVLRVGMGIRDYAKPVVRDEI